MSGAIRVIQLSAIPCCYRPDDRQGVGTIVETDAIRYKVYWRNGRGQVSWHPRGELAIPRARFRTAVAVTFQEVEVSMTAVVSRPGGTQVNFHIGDKVQVGTRVGTITDVGTSSSRSGHPKVAGASSSRENS